MTQLLVKVKNKTRSVNAQYKKIISDVKCYVFPENIESVPYSPETLLDATQWYVIENFSHQTFCLELIKRETFDSVDFEMFDRNCFSKMDYLCLVHDDIYFFQKIRPSQLLQAKRISFGESFTYDENSMSIVINTYADAIYVKDSDRLYFQKLETISSIFKGIEILFREATEEETKLFLQSDFISLGTEMNVSKVGKTSRKSVALAMTVLNSFNAEEKKRVMEYTKNYTSLQQDEKGFIIETEEDLKKLMLGIFERFYETPVSKKTRVANSIIDLQN